MNTSYLDKYKCGLLQNVALYNHLPKYRVSRGLI